jgi:precorrin-6B C5,15-methyltransferase / cobalt-precorrin-6B C5,C15-methyltransferase
VADGHIAVVGVLGGVPYGAEAARALATADVVVGSPRQLDEATVPPGAQAVALRGGLDAVLASVDERAAAGARVCVLASGDPGFFGIVRALGARVGPDRLAVHPAPSSVAVAFARLGLTWDDAVVVSAHGRPLADAVAAIVGGPAGSRPSGPGPGGSDAPAGKVAVLTAPDAPPEALGRALVAAGCPPRRVGVASHLGGVREQVVRTDLAGLAAGSFDPMSVVVLVADGAEVADAPSLVAGGVGQAGPGDLAFGRPEAAFDHRDGMITKAEVRAVALSKLALPAAGVLWDVGAGSGSVGIEAARLAPGLRVVAVERAPDQAARVRANAAAFGVGVTVVEGAAPAALAGLPDPDRGFVGGGGIDVLDAVRARVGSTGVVVATYTVVERALAARDRLGAMVQLSVARAAPIGGLGVRLAPENPVFVCWGPGGERPGEGAGNPA